MSARMITLIGGGDGVRLAINAEAVSEVHELVHGAGAEIVMVTGARMFVVATFDQVLDKMREDQPTERQRGRWVPVTNGRGGYECAECGNYAPSYRDGVEMLANYCPWCGAQMENGGEE